MGIRGEPDAVHGYQRESKQKKTEVQESYFHLGEL